MKRKSRHLANFEAQSLMLIAACAFGSASSLHAQQAPATVPPATTAPAAAGTGSDELAAAFKKSDTNSDGKLSRAEAQTMPSVARRFDQIDADADGMITRAEFDKAMKM